EFRQQEEASPGGRGSMRREARERKKRPATEKRGLRRQRGGDRQARSSWWRTEIHTNTRRWRRAKPKTGTTSAHMTPCASQAPPDRLGTRKQATRWLRSIRPRFTM